MLLVCYGDISYLLHMHVTKHFLTHMHGVKFALVEELEAAELMLSTRVLTDQQSCSMYYIHTLIPELVWNTPKLG